jgi:ABC-type polysaccharide/polyol phosphate export permease
MSVTIPGRATGRWSFARFIPVVEIELKGFLALKSSLIGDLLVGPVVYLALLTAGLAAAIGDGDMGKYLDFVLPGFLVLQGFNGFARTIFRSTIDRRWGLLALKRLSGVGGLAYVLAQVVVPVLAFLAKAVPVTVVALALGVRPDPLAYLGAVLLTCVFLAFWTSLAMLLTSVIRNYEQRDIMVSLLVLPISFSAPVFYSLENAPAYLRILAWLNPLSYQVNAVRAVYRGGSPGWWLPVALVATVILVAGAVISVTRGELLGREA